MTTTTDANKPEQPYPPSWIDRFAEWVETLPIKEWVFYLCLVFILIMVQVIFLLLAGGGQVVALYPLIIFNGLATSFLLGLIHFLDKQAIKALNSSRPVLDLDEAEFDQIQYRLSNMPASGTLISGLTILIIAVLIERLAIAPLRYEIVAQFPIFSIVYHIIDKSSAFLLGVFIYHTIRQLRLVNEINLNYIHISLVNLEPLQASSKLTAATAVGLVVGVYGWMLINPELLGDPVTLGFTLINSILAVVVFVWPLYGVHQRMEMEKEKLLQDVNLHFETIFSQFNQRLTENDFNDLDRLNRTISSLEIQHQRIKSIPTWPWKPETARIALTAIALPIILAILQILLEQAFGW